MNEEKNMHTFIWKIKLNPDQDEQELIAHWKETSSLLQTYPGAAGTKLHRDRDDSRSFFAVAQWESEAARDAMQKDVNDNTSEIAQRWNKYKKNEEFGTIGAVFSGNEIDRV